MDLFNRQNYLLLCTAIVLIIVGFILMKLDPVDHGFGMPTLTIAPILIVLGYIIGIYSIFAGSGKVIVNKKQQPFVFTGWSVFLISLTVYILTMEETASLWDCSEFIACTYKLQVPHPPGAPLFMLVGKIFSFFALGDLKRIAYWINMSSVVFSAITVMLTFHIIVFMGQRILKTGSKVGLILAGLTGALSLAFADSFWFSAVEAETYAMATFFLVLCFWLILKWERQQNSNIADKYLVFILYCLGLSVGVHPMSLLVIPALAVTIVFKYKEFSWKNLSKAVLSGAFGILFLNHIVLFGLPDLMKYADIFMVNVLSLPFYSGALLVMVVLAGTGIWAYRWSTRTRRRQISILLLGLMYFLLGYSSYNLIIIRSQADPSIDEHNPENLITLASYLKRESYGSNPFLYGPGFDSKVNSYQKGAPVYAKESDGYEIIDYKTVYEYGKDSEVLFPRMHSRQERHIATYRKWTGLKEGESPRMVDHLGFMIRYQFGHMYFRYLMFNFSGRASDIMHADWLSPLDLFGSVPDSLAKNKARNNFLMLPLLVGLLGLWYQYRSDKGGFYMIMICFLFLGLILVFYLNSPPNEPRERDYIYVGSYFAFSLWIGFGALAIHRLSKRLAVKMPFLSHMAIVALLVPATMLYIGYDDHNRSGRTLQVDHARNTLASCEPNAILFTGGDNDTFPLWYVQEVEGFRTDVRVIVLSYFNGDWYIDQMQNMVYDSDALPFSLEHEDYVQGGFNDILPYVENPGIKGAINLRRYLELVSHKSPAIQVSMADGSSYNSIPSRTFFLEVDQDRAHEIVPEKFGEFIPSKFHFSWQGDFMEKSAFMVLDIISTNQWERPIYFNNTSLNSIALDLDKNVLKEGQVYRLLPLVLPEKGGVNTSRMYENMMRQWQFNDLENDEIYYNYEDYQLRILQATKSCYNELAAALLDENQFDKAAEVINFVYANFLKPNIELDMSTVSTCDLLFRIGRADEAIQLAEALVSQADEMLHYVKKEQENDSMQGPMQLFILKQLHDIAVRQDLHDLAEKCSAKYNDHFSFNALNSH